MVDSPEKFNVVLFGNFPQFFLNALVVQVLKTGMRATVPEVGHVENGLLVSTKEVEKLLNTGQEAFVKLLESN